jgi:hypothetical protein
MKPSDLAKHQPYNSKVQKTESEIIARNIMWILKRTGNEWRTLSWEEYKEERLKDGNFSEYHEREYFHAVTCPENARGFCPAWAKAVEDFIYEEEMTL